MEIANPSLSGEAKPLAIVVLSGDQLWPNIQGILHWHRGGAKVEAVFLYCTLEESPTRGPAQRLQRFIEAYFTGVRVVLHAGSPASPSSEVRDTVSGWMNENPERRWVLNATGGLKHMALGLAGFAGTPEVQVVYRETSGEWFELVAVPEFSRVEARILEGIDPMETDALPVADLVVSQFGTAAESVELSAEPVNSLPMKRLTQEGIARGWNWPAVFAAGGMKADVPAEVLFGQYLGAGLLEMGVTNLVHRLQLTNKRDRKEKLEIDLAANHGGKMLVLDLELRGSGLERAADVLALQLRPAAELRQRLGGLSLQIVLVRPCRVFTEAERELARACGIEIIDQRDAPRLFSRLAGLLKVSALPPEMAAVEALLVEQVTQRGRLQVFGEEDDRLRQQAADSGGSEWVDIEAYLNRVRVERGQNWVLWATRSEIGLQLDRPANAPEELPNLIQKALSNFGRVRVEIGLNYYEAIFLRENSRLIKLRQALAGFVNRRLETMVFVQVRPHAPSPAPGAPRPAARPMAKPAASPALPPSGYGSLEDLDAAVDQVFRPQSPSKS